MATGERTATREYREPLARGGIAFGPILTGVVVAFGAMFLLSAIIGGVIAGLGYMENIETGQVAEVGIGAGIALLIAQFLSYMWGGYTAGRMGRGAGLANGLLVPLAAILIALLVVGIAAILGTQANLNLPFTTTQLPLQDQNLVEWGVGIGIATLVIMFLGGALGGMLGSRWHSKLERRTHDETIADDRVAPADGPEARREEPRTTGEGVRYESEGTRARRVDDGNGHTSEGESDREIDLDRERATGRTRR